MAELKKNTFKEEELLKIYPSERIHTTVPYLIEKYNALLELAVSYKEKAEKNDTQSSDKVGE